MTEEHFVKIKSKVVNKTYHNSDHLHHFNNEYLVSAYTFLMQLEFNTNNISNIKDHLKNSKNLIRDVILYYCIILDFRMILQIF